MRHSPCTPSGCDILTHTPNPTELSSPDGLQQGSKLPPYILKTVHRSLRGKRKNLLRRNLHSAESEQLSAQIFKRGAKMVNRVIYDKKTVMETIGGANLHQRV